ncbi:flavin monoamine oxidase family protein [Aspergillus lucknowensis]|uniref:Flavin-containing amine oxidase n=1 Tax=Aspergillus lucknowensis TaxID=176173 RepID=A0ABR4M3N3_9EURO
MAQHTPPLSTPHTKDFHICVIGAGISGLRAASLLSNAGFKVTVLEARDRIGGRVAQSSQLGFPIDLGASWIHGTQGNPFVDLARETGTTTVACGAVESICGSDGVWLDAGTAGTYYEEVWEVLEIAMERSRAGLAGEREGIEDGVRMMDFVRDEVRKRAAESGKLEEEYARVMLQIVEMWGAFMGDDCENQGLKNLALDAGLGGDNLLVASTFKDILNHLLLQVESRRTTLRLNCEVTSIVKRPTGGVDIEASDRFQGSFDDVVVTAPLGWLKRNSHVFSPPLPPAISTAIQSLGYGNLDKVFIKFPRAFWDDTQEPPSATGASGGTQNPLRPFPIESLFLSPNYALHTNPAKWRTEIICFSGAPGKYSQPVIMFFVYGQWGRHITGLIRGMKQDSDEYYRILDKHFRPYYSRMPNYRPASLDCKPLQYLSTDWQNDAFAGYGSFTNQPVMSGDCTEHFRVLREGIGKDQGIWFAGEHTSPPGGLGTVTGAYWSGEEVAKRVAQRHHRCLKDMESI